MKYCSRKCGTPERQYCTVSGCSKRINGHGLCNIHARRNRKYGDVNFVYSFKGSNNPMFGANRSGRLNPFFGKKHSKETILRFSNTLTGRKLSEEHKAKIRLGVPRGENSPHWKGKQKPRYKVRDAYGHRLWALKVKQRDNFTCQICGQVGGILHSDHIKKYALYPELRLDLLNGRTLCISCHRKTDNYGNRKNKVLVNE